MWLRKEEETSHRLGGFTPFFPIHSYEKSNSLAYPPISLLESNILVES